ncbi:MAG TPA: GGDEF domain-containing protein [Candidatus Limnocylindrales bacterium]|nr:GGDEF domain-containing protein [Candidatus Limnocylindrales bacterium]
MIKELATSIARLRKVTIVLFALAFANVLAFISVMSGGTVDFLLFYLVPGFLCSWFISRNSGIFAAVWASLVWFAGYAMPHGIYSQTWGDVWNLLMRTGLFVSCAIMQAQLRAKFDDLFQLAARDLLTGLPNGQAFYELAAIELHNAFGAQPMTLATIDVGGLQTVNYRFGYPAGDRMLSAIAQTIKQYAPRPDLVGRTGGTSFSVFLPNTTSDSANAILQRLHDALDEQRRQSSHPLTFFFSAVACSKPPKTVAELLHQADSQLDRMRGAKTDIIQVAALEDLPALN